MDGDLEETDRYVNEKGRLDNRDFETDRPGRSSQSSSRRSSMEKGDGPREHEEKKFARRIAKSINEALPATSA
jgi:protein required for attachment to host cells